MAEFVRNCNALAGPALNLNLSQPEDRQQASSSSHIYQPSEGSDEDAVLPPSDAESGEDSDEYE